MDVKYYLDYIEVPILLKVKVIDKPRWSMQAITGTAMGPMDIVDSIVTASAAAAAASAYIRERQKEAVYA